METTFYKDRAFILSVTDPMTTWLFSQTDSILNVVNNFNVISNLLTLVFMSRCFLYSLIENVTISGMWLNVTHVT